MPAYNRAAVLARALRSIEAQRPGRPAEVIVVDDASSDATAAEAAHWGAHVIRHAANRGVAAARNTGVAAATQPWIALLDADDEWLPHHLASLWALRQDHVLVGCAVIQRRRAGDRFHGPVGRHARILRSPAPLVHPHNFLANSASMFRRDVVRSVGGYETGLQLAEDLDLSVRVLERGTGIVSPRVGALWHEHSGQATEARKRMRSAHQAVAAAYANRQWWSEGLRRRSEGAEAWDDLRAALRSRDGVAAISSCARIAASPNRVLGVAGLLLWRARGRRSARRALEAGFVAP